MVAGVQIEHHQVVMVAEAMMNQTIVVARMEDHQMVVVVDQLVEIQVADLLIAEMEVAQGILVAGHHLHNLLMEEEAVVEIGAKAHQPEAVAHHPVTEEEPVARKALLHGAKELPINQHREIELRLYFSY